MNMETTSNTDLDKLEEMLHNKMFDELSPADKQWVANRLSEEEYTSMSALYTVLKVQKQSIDIEPHEYIKNKLDKAFAAKASHKGVFRLNIPLYQTAAAAIIFFFVGSGVNVFQPEQTKVIHTTSQVIKYVDRPVKLIQYVKIPVQIKEKQKEKGNKVIQATDNIVNSGIPEFNSEYLRQQEIAMTNINHVLNEQNGSSMGGDTVLQKMLVTVY